MEGGLPAAILPSMVKLPLIHKSDKDKDLSLVTVGKALEIADSRVNLREIRRAQKESRKRYPAPVVKNQAQIEAERFYGESEAAPTEPPAPVTYGWWEGFLSVFPWTHSYQAANTVLGMTESAGTMSFQLQGQMSGYDMRTASRMTEDIGVGVGYNAFGMMIDPDDYLYRRLTQAQRELPPIIQERALRLVWSLYESNPLAHGIVEMEKDYIVGKGFTTHSANEDVQKVIDKHWEDGQNNWSIKQHDRVRDLCLYGEGLYLAFTNDGDGMVRIASVDPIQIRSVYTDPENVEQVQTIVCNPFKRVSSGGFSTSDRFYRVIHEDTDPASDTYGYLVGARPGEVFQPLTSKKTYAYDGSCFFFAINKVTGAVRGRSDLLSVIDWLDAYDQILFNFVDRTLLMNSFVWDVTIQDATRAQLMEWRREHSAAPKSGTVNVHNQNEKWEAVSPTFQRAEFEVQQKTLKAQILAAVGMPPHWFGEQEANRATAIEQNSPALKRLESRQLYIQYVVHFVLQYQIDQAILHGKLDKPPVDEPYAFEVSTPRMGSKDLSQASTSMLAVTQALTIALSAGLVDLVEARRIFVELAKELGADISLDEMLDRLGDSWDKYYSDSNQPLEPNTIPGGGTQQDPASKPKAPVTTATPTGAASATTRSARRPAVSEHTVRRTFNPYMPVNVPEAIAVLRNQGYDIVIKSREPNVEVEVGA